ncbi:hypothetical protein ABIA31_008021 [Catenulispora sp. MAP5-51]|uniref:hypothetical protein n=1 Tax=Catenulispora sp. MAP5-51 TaxID=3156298 RepID=UPI0035149F04
MSFLKLFIAVIAASGMLLGAGAASATAAGRTGTGTASVVRADDTLPASDGDPACTSCWG